MPSLETVMITILDVWFGVICTVVWLVLGTRRDELDLWVSG
jgi:hypothetical protein